jgi:SAM-dependent methyltransferase
MSIEKLIDHERQHIAVVVSETSAGWASNGLAARYQHDFSSNYIGGSSLSRATHRGLGEPQCLTAQGGEGFAAIAELLGSRVQHRRGDALALDGPPERFDVVLCFGILHRVENPLGLLRRLAALLAPGGRLLVETYGIASDGRVDAHDRAPATGRRLRRRRLRLLGLRRGRAGRDRPAGRPGRGARRRHRRPRLARGSWRH